MSFGSHPNVLHLIINDFEISKVEFKLFLKGKTIDDIHPDVLNDCAQLTKANSIQGI